MYLLFEIGTLGGKNLESSMTFSDSSLKINWIHIYLKYDQSLEMEKLLWSLLEYTDVWILPFSWKLESQHESHHHPFDYFCSRGNFESCPIHPANFRSCLFNFHLFGRKILHLPREQWTLRWIGMWCLWTDRLRQTDALDVPRKSKSW